jgi:hypothetical protein
LSGIPFEKMLAVLSTAPLDTVILLLIYSQDVTGRSFTSPNLAQQLSQVATAPIFGLLEAALGYGIVGGSLISFERIGDKAGELALDILKGNLTTKNIADPLEAPPVSMFDWRQLRRWKLDEDALPEGTVVVNREFTFWDLKYYAHRSPGLYHGPVLPDRRAIGTETPHRDRPKSRCGRKRRNWTGSSASPWTYCALQTRRDTFCA